MTSICLFLTQGELNVTSSAVRGVFHKVTLEQYLCLRADTMSDGCVFKGWMAPEPKITDMQGDERQCFITEKM